MIKIKPCKTADGQRAKWGYSLNNYTVAVMQCEEKENIALRLATPKPIILYLS
jgi:hypothetical protein